MNNQRFRQEREQTGRKNFRLCPPLIINPYLPPHAYSNNIRQAAILAAIAPPHRSAAVEQISEVVVLHLGFGLGCNAGSVTWSGGVPISCYGSVAIAITIGVCGAGEPESSYIIRFGCACHISRGIAVSRCAGRKLTCETACVNLKTASGENISDSKTIANT